MWIWVLYMCLCSILTAWFNLAPEIQSINILDTAVVNQYMWIQRTKILTSSPRMIIYRIKQMSISDPRNVAAICIENMSSAWTTRLQRRWWCFLILSKFSVTLIKLCRSSRIFPVLWLNSHARLFVIVNRRADGAIHAKSKYICATRLMIFTTRTLEGSSSGIIGNRISPDRWKLNIRYPQNAAFKQASNHITPVQMLVSFFRDAVFCAHPHRNLSHSNRNSGRRL